MAENVRDTNIVSAANSILQFPRLSSCESVNNTLAVAMSSEVSFTVIHDDVITSGKNDHMGDEDASQKGHSAASEVEIFIVTSPLCPAEKKLYPHGRCSECVEKVEMWVHKLCRRQKKNLFLAFQISAGLLYLTYFVYCVQYRYFDEGSYILTAITGAVAVKILFRFAHRRGCCYLGQDLYRRCLVTKRARRLRHLVKISLYITATVLLCVYLGVFVLSQNPRNIQALLGLASLILTCFLLSASPSKVNWHPVFWGLIIQFAFAVLTLRTQIGYDVFKWVGDLVHSFVRLSDKGSAFVLGDSFRATKAGFFFECAGVIVFFNSFIFVLDYYGVLEFIVLKLGRAMSMCLETGPVESVVSAANIFIGLSEAPLLVRPYLPTVTRSELHAIMTCGFSSISGAFMAMFIKSGAPASHLLTAAVISAPAALAISKLMYPEMEAVDIEGQKDITTRDHNSPKSLVQAASDGAAFSIKLVATIMVNMMAFVSMLSLIDTVMVWGGERAGVSGMTFDFLCSYLLYPFAYVMGIAPEDCGKVGALIGIKLMATPFVAYAELGGMIKNRHIFENYVRLYNETWYASGDDVILTETNTTLIKGLMS
ncbi:hypothetical protein Btru_028135, partial [Bulinus truncatus]